MFQTGFPKSSQDFKRSRATESHRDYAFPDFCFDNYVARKINYNTCSDTLSFTKIIYALNEVLKNLHTYCEKIYELIIKIQIYKKKFKVIRLLSLFN